MKDLPKVKDYGVHYETAMQEIGDWTVSMGAPEVPHVSNTFIHRIVGRPRETNRYRQDRRDSFAGGDRGRRDFDDRRGGYNRDRERRFSNDRNDPRRHSRDDSSGRRFDRRSDRDSEPRSFERRGRFDRNSERGSGFEEVSGRDRRERRPDRDFGRSERDFGRSRGRDARGEDPMDAWRIPQEE